MIEGNSMTYEIVVPEKNDQIAEAVLDAAKAAKQRIAIRPTRLQMLLDVEKKLAQLEAMKRKKLETLHEKEKSNTSAVNERMRRYVEAHRDEINARRREQRATKSVPKSSTTSIVIIKRVCKQKEQSCQDKTKVVERKDEKPALSESMKHTHDGVISFV